MCKPTRGRFFSPIYLGQAFYPRYNTFIWPRNICLDITSMFFRCYIWAAHLSKLDKFYPIICLGRARQYACYSDIFLSFCLGKGAWTR